MLSVMKIGRRDAEPLQLTAGRPSSSSSVRSAVRAHPDRPGCCVCGNVGALRLVGDDERRLRPTIAPWISRVCAVCWRRFALPEGES